MAKLLYSMGEVTEMFDVNASLIRYWESKFDCIRPRKNKKGNRLFTPEDVENLKLIYHLVKEKGMTLEGANRTMKHNRRSVAGDASLLERLQKIRAMLVEVRESLKDDGTAAYVKPDEPAEADIELDGPQAVVEPVEEPVAEKPAEPMPTVEEPVAPVVEEPVAEEQPVADVAPEEKPAEEKPAKSSAPKRRRKKREEEKELFPFYEQSLF